MPRVTLFTTGNLSEFFYFKLLKEVSRGIYRQ
jgi:hypothetical protein